MRPLICLLLAAVLLSGCQTADDALDTSAAPTAISSPAASAIAGDMASRLAEQVGSAGTTTIVMEKGTSEFAVALEAALKGWGYTVITDGKAAKDTKQIEISYAIDSVDGQALARITTPTLALARAYTATPAGATPASPLSILQRN